MFFALFILLFVAQGIQVDPSTNDTQIHTNQKQDTAAYRTTEPFPMSPVESVAFARDYQQNAAKDTCKPTNSKSEATENWIVFFTGILAAASIYQAIRSHRDSQLELRAYVFFEQVRQNLRLPTGTHKWHLGTFNYKNSGKTPAYDVSLKYAIATGPKSRSEFSSPATETPITHMLASGGVTQFEVTSERLGGSSDLINLIKNGERVIYFLGEIRYRDVFSKGHITSFRLFTEWDRDHLTGLTLCREGNDAT